MQRIIIPTHYVHTRSTPLWTRETAPASIHHDTSTTSKFVPDLFAPRSAADKAHFIDFDKMVENIFGL